MNTVDVEKEKITYKRIIITISIVVPVLVAVLFRVQVPGYDFSFLPPIYASLNALTAVFLVAAFVAIKNKNRKLHETFMKICIMLSAAFLIMYVLYHMTSSPTEHKGEGVVLYVYYFILISHILLSICVIPLVLFTYLRAWLGEFERHRALAKFTFPIWLYVAVTGVIVYLMISPYYK